MRYTILLGLVVLLYTNTKSQTLSFPYTSGKQANSFEINLNNGNSISPTLIQVGNVFSIQPYYDSDGELTCGNLAELGLQILVTGGQVQKTPARNPNWTSYNQYPDSALLAVLDTVPQQQINISHPSNLTRSPGFIFAHTGSDNNCIGSVVSISSDYSQVVFVHKGGFYAKIKITGYSLTDNSRPTFPDQVLNKITVRYLVSDNPNVLLDTAVPAPPVLFSPAQNATGVPVSTNLTWNPSFGSVSYRIQLATDSLFASILLDDSTLTTTTKVAGSLSVSTAYYWRVNAKNAYGTSAYSTVWKFTTGTAAIATNGKFFNKLPQSPFLYQGKLKNTLGRTVPVQSLKIP